MAHKAGKRHLLLVYQRWFDRIWLPMLVLGLAMGALWGLSGYFFDPLVPPTDLFVSAGAGACLAFALFALLARNLAYVQARQGYLLVATPFFRLKVSYKRVRQVRSASFEQLFPRQKMGWAQKQFLEPFYGRTVVVVDLAQFPLSRGLMRLFLARPMFSPQGTGLVFVVKDWMALSMEIDSYRGMERQAGGTPSVRRPRGQA